MKQFFFKDFQGCGNPALGKWHYHPLAYIKTNSVEKKYAYITGIYLHRKLDLPILSQFYRKKVQTNQTEQMVGSLFRNDFSVCYKNSFKVYAKL